MKECNETFKKDMRKNKRFLIIPILILCAGLGMSTKLLTSSNCMKQDLFSDYLRTFKEKSLPVKLSRKHVLELEDLNNNLTEIKDSLLVFIPSELRKNFTSSTFKRLYLLPKHCNNKVVLLLHKFINQYDANVFKVYMVIYGNSGNILDYKELAGFNLDVWEAFLAIDENYKISRKVYNFKLNDDLQAEYFHLLETSYEYELNTRGFIKELSKFKQEGYFDGDSSGYKLVEEY
ncbi:hypothetical protein [Marinifilum sp.]|uniref:hypothetical protein n=1 Tax=Marinifilum sp. TaxID=2033137 RepID=UPI003BAB722A